jgi:hypothetical protein
VIKACLVRGPRTPSTSTEKPDLLHRKRKAATARTRLIAADLLTNRKGSDDMAAAIDDDDLIADDEVLMAAPFRPDFDQGVWHRHQPHSLRHDDAHVELEVDACFTRHVRTGEDRLPNMGPLLIIQLDAAVPALVATVLILPHTIHGCCQFP